MVATSHPNPRVGVSVLRADEAARLREKQDKYEAAKARIFGGGGGPVSSSTPATCRDGSDGASEAVGDAPACASATNAVPQSAMAAVETVPTAAGPESVGCESAGHLDARTAALDLTAGGGAQSTCDGGGDGGSKNVKKRAEARCALPRGVCMPTGRWNPECGCSKHEQRGCRPIVLTAVFSRNLRPTATTTGRPSDSSLLKPMRILMRKPRFALAIWTPPGSTLACFRSLATWCGNDPHFLFSPALRMAENGVVASLSRSLLATSGYGLSVFNSPLVRVDRFWQGGVHAGHEMAVPPAPQQCGFFGGTAPQHPAMGAPFACGPSGAANSARPLSGPHMPMHMRGSDAFHMGRGPNIQPPPPLTPPPPNAFTRPMLPTYQPAPCGNATDHDLQNRHPHYPRQGLGGVELGAVQHPFPAGQRSCLVCLPADPATNGREPSCLINHRALCARRWSRRSERCQRRGHALCQHLADCGRRPVANAD